MTLSEMNMMGQALSEQHFQQSFLVGNRALLSTFSEMNAMAQVFREQYFPARQVMAHWKGLFLNPKPSTPNLKPHTPNPRPLTPHSTPQNSNPKTQTPNSKFQTLHPTPQPFTLTIQVIVRLHVVGWGAVCVGWGTHPSILGYNPV